jgi:hypothetical protein
MTKGSEKTLLIVALVAIGGLLLWLFLKGKKAQASSGGGSKGVFGTISAGVSGVTGVGESIVHGTTSIVSDAMPWNW